MSEDRTVIVFVHLGGSVPRELLHHAKLASQFVPWEDIYLITDDSGEGFLGNILFCDPSKHDPRFQKYLNRFPEISERDGGYWEKTLRRLLALEVMTSVLNPKNQVIHIESDVMLLLPLQDIVGHLTKFDKVSIPRLGSFGIASFMYFPGSQAIRDFCSVVLKTLDKTVEPLTDMKLLGIGLRDGWLQELESVPSHSFGEPHIIFDGAAIGQYLFGINPIHNEGRLISGFQNPYYPMRLDSIRWRIEKTNEGNSSTLIAQVGPISFSLANLHIHSKELLPLPSMGSLRWMRALDEANGGERKLERRSLPTKSQSNSGVSMRGRIVIARRVGFMKVIRKIFIRVFTCLMKSN